ncbi:HMG-like DNA binding protein, putative [Candida dubliniensis CD36]|uniref:Non-histone DNA-binding protein, putative n=1 Tax=Candida dubliniensis (strain CD36 / ATCC MYA-646 / CBS 7987 / NCPF 3949 / NRRL Y-17841) TaxID=573826 RepID=B9WD90_CANDC|nr:HMG-like DNA binding protein, putative [Candida dubliniensis CD36]CAX42640.1 HMG-like DNA binding protein, putative [Candida dubliniensis CD36]
MKTPSKDSIPESEEVRFKQKCKELRKRVLEIEESNEIATIALSRTQATIRRLRLEYAILLERLEDRATQLPEGIVAFEEMACPPTPTILDDSLVKSNKSSNKKSKTSSSSSSSSKTTLGSGSSKLSNGPSDVASTTMGKQKARDPDLPKRPTNAYLIFCEMEKERIKQDDPNASDLSKSMTEAWKSLSEERRRPYYKLYEDDRIRYQREMAEYNQKKGNGGEPDLKKQKLPSQPEQPQEEEEEEEEEQVKQDSSIGKETTEITTNDETKQATEIIKSEENSTITATAAATATATEENKPLENINSTNETTES